MTDRFSLHFTYKNTGVGGGTVSYLYEVDLSFLDLLTGKMRWQYLLHRVVVRIKC